MISTAASARHLEPRLVRSERVTPQPVTLDDDQLAAVSHRGGPLLLLAGPGTGKTTTIVEAVVDRVSRGEITASQALVLTFSRLAAAQLRERITGRLATTSRQPVARTFHSYAFGLLRAEAALRGEDAPRLLSGPEQDVVVRELLRGDVEVGAVGWPSRLRPALLTRGFAQELRDLLQRAVERGLSPADLASLGRRYERDDWIAAARFARQYEQVSVLREAASYDPAELIRAATALLRAEPAVLARVRDAHRFVVVDEYQDTDPAQDELLRLLSGSRDLLAVGDPDQSIYGFRGADPDGIRLFPDRYRSAEGAPATVMTLQVSRRSGPVLLAASRRVAGRLGGTGAHRALVAGGSHLHTVGGVEVHILGSAVAEAAYVAYRLRSAHLIDGVEWSRMAVLIRAADAAPALRRSLLAAGVPVVDEGAGGALVEVPVNRALLSVLEIATGRRRLGGSAVADGGQATGEGSDGPALALDLLTGPLGDADALAVRRLRQELRRLELLAGGGRSSATLLADALDNPIELATIDPRIAGKAVRVARLIAAAREAATVSGATAESLLWEVWKAAGLAERWRGVALGAGAASSAGSAGTAGAAAAAAGRADRDLDAVVALFESAARFSDRLPKAGPQVFLDQMLGQQIAGDSLAARAPTADGVRLMTAHASKGLEWDVVVVAGVQEGRWPDLRARGSFLGAERLVEVLGGREIAGADVPLASTARLAEERRLFYVATTRARELLVVTAVRGDDAQPSRFLDELVPFVASGPADAAGAVHDQDRPLSRVPRGLDLAAVVADLRVALSTGPAVRRRAAATQLGRLADAGVRSAHPGDWYGLQPLTDDAPLAGDDEQVRVSPSRVEAFQRCPLRWMLESSGGTKPDSASQQVGTLVHALAEQAGLQELTPQQVRERLVTALDRVDLGTGWFAGRQRERATDIVRKLNSWLAANPRAVIAVERAFEVEIGRAQIRGKVDRLERDGDGRLVVVDLKTGKSMPTTKELESHPQLGVYQLAVEHGAFDDVGSRESGGAELVQLGSDRRTERIDQQERLAGAPNPNWALELVDRCAAGMAGAVFAAVDNALCVRCPVRSSCPLRDEGRQVTS